MGFWDGLKSLASKNHVSRLFSIFSNILLGVLDEEIDRMIAD